MTGIRQSSSKKIEEIEDQNYQSGFDDPRKDNLELEAYLENLNFQLSIIFDSWRFFSIL